MSERTDKDLERTAEEALDRLARGWDPLSLDADASTDAAREDEALVASHLEALSLLAYAVQPVAPPAELRAKVLRAAAAEPKTRSRPVAVATPMLSTPAALPAALDQTPVDVTLRQISNQTSVVDTDPGDMTLVGLGSGDSPSGPSLDVGDVQNLRTQRDVGETTVRTEFSPPPRAANSNVPLYLLAAGLVFCLIGLGYLYGQLQNQSSQYLDQEKQLQAQMQQALSEAESLRARVQMVTDVARMAYPLQQIAAGQGAVRTVGRPEPGEVRPDGIVYVCGQHKRWYLSLSGFDPAPEGKVYHLWFKTEDGAVDAGPLDLSGDGRADVGDLSMPEGTQGFMVSLEDASDEGLEPHGQIILKGDQPVKL